MNMMPETLRNGVRFSTISGSFKHGCLVHTGGVTGSIPVSPTIYSATFRHVNEAPSGTSEPEERRCMEWETTPEVREGWLDELSMHLVPPKTTMPLECAMAVCRDLDKALAEIDRLTKLLTSIKAHAAGALDDADDLPDGWTPDYELVLVRIIEKVDTAHAQ